MFQITERQFDEIADVIMKYCCDCSSYYCSEIGHCDVSDILEILASHVEKESTGGEEKLPFDV